MNYANAMYSHSDIGKKYDWASVVSEALFLSMYLKQTSNMKDQV